MPVDSFESPLTLAACGGHTDLAQLLIDRGANIEEVSLSLILINVTKKSIHPVSSDSFILRILHSLRNSVTRYRMTYLTFI